MTIWDGLGILLILALGLRVWVLQRQRSLLQMQIDTYRQSAQHWKDDAVLRAERHAAMERAFRLRLKAENANPADVAGLAMLDDEIRTIIAENQRRRNTYALRLLKGIVSQEHFDELVQRMADRERGGVDHTIPKVACGLRQIADELGVAADDGHGAVHDRTSIGYTEAFELVDRITGFAAELEAYGVHGA